MKGRSVEPISKAWAALHAVVEVRTDCIRLSRLIRWLSAEGITPDTVTLQDLERFHRMVVEEAMLRDPAATWIDTARAWDRCVKRVAGWPQMPIRIENRSKTYSLPWSAFPVSLKQDVDGWLARLSGRDFAEEGPARPLAEVSLRRWEYRLRTFASALVLRARDPASLTSLAACLTIDNYTEGLRFHRSRSGEKSTAAVHSLAGMLKGVARHWVKADEATLQRMSAIMRKLDAKQSGLTPKNRERLLPFNDQETCLKLLNLPQVLRREVERGNHPVHHRRVLAQMAVAIEILLFVPLRIKNLASIEIHRHLRKAGATLLLTFPAAEVKNGADLEFELLEPSAELLRWYIEAERSAGPANPYLFPGATESHKTEHTLAVQIMQSRLHRPHGEPASLPPHRGQALSRRQSGRLRSDAPRPRSRQDGDHQPVLCRARDAQCRPSLR